LAQEVALALADCQDVKAHQRLVAMRMAVSGQFTSQQIAQQLGISRRRFFDWVKIFKSSGLVGLLKCGHGGGAVPRVSGNVLADLQAGLVTGRWKRAKEIQQWLGRVNTTCTFWEL
jgi:transposase-like protein